MKLKCPECGQSDKGFECKICFPIKFDANGKASINIKLKDYDIVEEMSIDDDSFDIECLGCHYINDISDFEVDDEWWLGRR